MKKATATMKKSGSSEEKDEDSPSRLIDARIEELSDWRGQTLARVRTLIRQAEPEVVEEWKWRGVPVWERAGHLHRRDLQKRGEADLRQRRLAGGPFRPFQLQP